MTHHNPFELLVATILSAQCTDERVNMVMPVLFKLFPTAQAMAGADREQLEMLIKSTGFFRAKAAHILGASEAIVMRHGGEVPRSMEELTALPGVGRKTANVVLSVAFNLPGLPVDTHVTRLSQRLALTGSNDPVQIEQDLCGLFPPRPVGCHQPSAHPPRTPGLRRPAPPLRDLRGRRPLPLAGQVLTLGPSLSGAEPHWAAAVSRSL